MCRWKCVRLLERVQKLLGDGSGTNRDIDENDTITPVIIRRLLLTRDLLFHRHIGIYSLFFSDTRQE